MTVSSYAKLLADTYEAIPTSYPSGTATSKIESLFMNSEIDFIATDDPILQVIEATNCKVSMALNQFRKLSFGMMFGQNVDPSIYYAINEGINYVRQKVTQEERFKQFFAKEKLPLCSGRHSTGEQSYNILDIQALLYLSLIHI
eukprot:TRINITY_DN11799_c0_g1_i1.p1 TRINITY_DN11799_c0_g1~~TRINITY_DN11799_c0_g1_i1.p1  ORF type:complete len:144 (-),score=12.64 TRINITY_DN11799_c0_g1_i1:59-490(-)